MGTGRERAHARHLAATSRGRGSVRHDRHPMPTVAAACVAEAHGRGAARSPLAFAWALWLPPAARQRCGARSSTHGVGRGVRSQCLVATAHLVEGVM